ncbi:MAG: E3 binding domain-containing protein [Planctomycetales bacterium]|nr:E3 binding domain-containing protein [Planctomycetales bacterium]
MASSTPRARRLARQLKLNLTEVSGTGANGRICARDIARQSPALPSTQAATGVVELKVGLESPWNLCGQLGQLSAYDEPEPLPGDLLIKAVAAAAELCPPLWNACRAATSRSSDAGRQAGISLGYGLLTEPLSWIEVPNEPWHSVRDIAHWSKTQRTAKLLPMESSNMSLAPSLLVLDCLRWGMTHADFPLPPGSVALLTFIGAAVASASPLDEGDGANATASGRLRLRFDVTRLSPAAALKFLHGVAELLESPHWMLGA